MFKCSFQIASAAAAAVLALALTSSAKADPILVNGSFSQSTNGTGQLGYNTDVTGWTDNNNGYNFLFSPSTVSTTGSQGAYNMVALWGPGNGSNNGLGASPDGGNFVGLDGAFGVGSLSQLVTGLTIGRAVNVSFYFAGAQQYNYDGVTTESLAVSLGGVTQNTATVTNASHGFTGWQKYTMTFVPTSTSATLSFLAAGTPNGEPPFSLLDGVTVTNAPAPEPNSLLLLATGLMGTAGLVRRRITKPKA